MSLASARLQGVADTARRMRDEVDEADPTTADILHVVIEKLEQFAWMVSAETQKPRKRDS